MSTTQATSNDPAEFWSNEGGRRWVRYIDRLERMATGLSAHLIRAVDVQPGEHVLDVGCGGGLTSAAYAEAVGAGGRVLGVDISEVILEVARRRHGALAHLHFVAADAGVHSFQAGEFDVVTSRFGVMFFPDPVSAFSNLRRALKPTARLCFMCWRPIDENPWMGAPAAAAFSVLGPPEKPAPGTPGPFSLSDPARVREILSSANFSNVELEKVDEMLSPGTVDQALEQMSHLGPAATPLAEATPADREAALAAMRKVLEENDTPQGVTLPGAAWLVRADTGR